MSQQPPNRFNPYQDDPDRIGPHDRTTRRLERSPADNDDPDRDKDWREMVSQNWRRGRHGRGQFGSDGPFSLPRSSAEFMPWVERGGWKVLAAVATGIVLLTFVLLVSSRPIRGDGEPSPQGQEQQQADTVLTPMPTGPIMTPGLQQPGSSQPSGSPTIPTLPPQNQVVLVVTGTGVQGLFLRTTPGGPVLATLPEGTRVEVIGEDQQAPDSQGINRVWKNIREPGGQTGWAAVDFLKPAP